MKNIMHELLIEDLTIDIDSDLLFETLEQISPPADFVEQVMQKVARLPLPTMPKVPWSHLSPVAIENESPGLS